MEHNFTFGGLMTNVWFHLPDDNRLWVKLRPAASTLNQSSHFIRSDRSPWPSVSGIRILRMTSRRSGSKATALIARRCARICTVRDWY